jgi:hypothetical protein
MAESIVTLRVPPDRVVSWKRLAAARGLSVSQLIRSQMELVDADVTGAVVGVEPSAVPAVGPPASRRLRSVPRPAGVVEVSSGRPSHHPRCSCFVCTGRLRGASS